MARHHCYVRCGVHIHRLGSSQRRDQSALRDMSTLHWLLKGGSAMGLILLIAFALVLNAAAQVLLEGKK